MTQDANNQEWWEETLNKLLWQNLDIHNESGTARPMKAGMLDDLRALFRKVSQQSREDAFREVYEEFGKEWGQKVDEGTTATAYLVCLDTVRAILKSKLPPKQ